MERKGDNKGIKMKMVFGCQSIKREEKGRRPCLLMMGKHFVVDSVK